MVASEKGTPARDVDPLKRLALYCYSAGDHAGALEALNELRVMAPGDLEVIENIGVILRLGGRLDEAVAALLEVHRCDPSRLNVCDALAHCYANLGDKVETQRFGRLALELKDREAANRQALQTLPTASPPLFVSGERNRHLIAFSLWGENPRYLRGAIRNVTAAVDIYPDWTCRFYCDDSVPATVLDQLRAGGAEVIMRPRPTVFYEGLLWRFEVINDPDISHFLIRDCDSVVNVKERVAVDEWLRSGKWFHAMRDFASHTEVILAGMWGGVAGVLPPLTELRRHFKPTTAPTRTYDQHLLRENVWPIVRQSALIHDSVYTGCLGSIPFPNFGELPPKNHVGQNEAAVRPGLLQAGASPVSLEPGKGRSSLFLITGMDDEAVWHLGSLFRDIPGVRCLLEIGEDVTSLLPLADSFDVKIICVIRDPRDTASAKHLTGVGPCEELAEAWIRHIESIATANRKLPGCIEIVRHEDLTVETGAKTLARLTRFLGITSAPEITIKRSSAVAANPLPNELLSVMEAKTMAFLAKLRYPAGSNSIEEAG